MSKDKPIEPTIWAINEQKSMQLGTAMDCPDCANCLEENCGVLLSKIANKLSVSSNDSLVKKCGNEKSIKYYCGDSKCLVYRRIRWALSVKAKVYIDPCGGNVF